MEMIIPADGHSGGASEAKAPAFADLMVSTGDEVTKRTWRNGIHLLEKASSETSLDLVLARLATKEKNPETELEKFFSILKLATVRGYYTSWIGIHQDMEYQGNEYRTSAPACNHPEHQE
jgi:Gluconate 2-dehydrogenase subunit 3